MNRRLRTGLIILGYFTALGLLRFGYRYLEYVSNRKAVPALVPFIDELLTGAWMAALLFPFVAKFARRCAISRATWTTRVPLHLCALFVYSLAHTSLIWASRKLLYSGFGLGRYDYGLMRARYPMEFFMDVIAYVVMVSILYLFDHHVRAAQLEGKLAQARLANLRLQLRPHFLYNTLNAISSMVYEDPRKADVMIGQLANFLRATISDTEAQEVSLEHEIEILELYLDIMRHRFEDRMHVDLRVAPDVRKALAPHLFLQPLVENSFRHGVNPESHAIAVRITADRDGSDTRVRVRDWGCGLPRNGIRWGTGISNTAERLRQLYGARQRLEFENCEDGGLMVTVTFPYRT